MRDQQRVLMDTILGAKAGRSLKIDAPFLTFRDLLDCVREVAKHLGGDPEALSPHTVQGWFKAGAVTEYNKKRITRNRLYCGIDLIRVASVFYLTHTSHVHVKTAGVIADAAVKEIKSHFEQLGQLKPEAGFVPSSFIVAVTRKGRWKIFCTEDRKFLDIHLMCSGLSLVFNHNLLIGLAYPILGNKWKEKALWLRGVIEREIAKKTAKKGFQ